MMSTEALMETLARLHFLRPLWFLALMPVALLLALAWRRSAPAAAWQGLVDAHLLPHLLEGRPGGARRWPLLLAGLAALLLVTALAGPAWERLPRPVFAAQDWRVIVLDLSPGMNASDLPPSRLAQARFEVLDLLRLAREGETALIAYGAEPFVVAPLTRDAATIAAQVPDLATGLLPVAGAKRTDLALALAGDLLQGAGARHGRVILITDGVADAPAADGAASRLRDMGYRLSVLGMGTPAGAPVPLPDGGFLKDDDGAILLPRLDEEALRALARTGGGIYLTARAGEEDARRLLGEDAGRDWQDTGQDRQAEQWRDEGAWLLLAVLPLAWLAFRRGWYAPLVLLLFLPPPPAQADWADWWARPDQQGARLLATGQAEEAAGRFQRPDWKAVAHYRAGDSAAALEALQGQEGPDAHYNRGNVLARLGRLAEAVQAYEQALSLRPDDDDARHNLDLVRRLLAEQEPPPGGDAPPRPAGDDAGGSEAQHTPAAGDGADGNGTDGDRDADAGAASADPGGEGDEGQGATRSGTAPGPAPEASSGRADRGGTDDAGPEPGRDDLMAGTPGPERPESGGPDGHSPDAGDIGTPEVGATADRDRGEEGSSSDAAAEAGDRTGVAAGEATEGTEAREARLAAEQMLRRVPDDPAGLLRQRFLLQHLQRGQSEP